MDHWAGSPNYTFRSSSDAAIDMHFKDELLLQDCWMETAVLQPGYLYDSAQYLPIFSSNHPSLDSFHDPYPEEMESSLENPPLEHAVIDEHVVQVRPSLIPSQSFPVNNSQLSQEWRIGYLNVENPEEASQEFVSSPVKDSSPDESSWTLGMMKETDSQDSYGRSLWGCLKEEPEDEFKVTAYLEKNELDLNHDQVYADSGQVEENSGVTCDFVGERDSRATRRRLLGNRKQGEKRQTKPEKGISLQVLRQHFAQSLKDAAKCMGVCPTTLKRICRQHGITRWPSRKIKKVNHSLRKLQLVVDSVEGAEGFIQIGSLCSTFPELSSPNLPKTKPFSPRKLRDNSKELKPQPTFDFSTPKCANTNSDSSSSGQNLGSSMPYFTEAKQLTTIIGGLSTDNSSEFEEPVVVLDKTSEEAESCSLEQEEPINLPNPQSLKALGDCQGLKILPRTLEDGGALKVKATFGESNIRFSLQPQWNFKDLQHEIAKRFSIDDLSGIYLKYVDNDLESILLTCDEDLEECKDLFRSSNNHTIKMSIHQAPLLNLTSLYSSRCLV